MRIFSCTFFLNVIDHPRIFCRAVSIGLGKHPAVKKGVIKRITWRVGWSPWRVDIIFGYPNLKDCF